VERVLEVGDLRELSVDELVRLVWMQHDEIQRLRAEIGDRDVKPSNRDTIAPCSAAAIAARSA
jgi:hypothetical protein